MSDYLSDDAKAYYADGFKVTLDGAPMKRFSQRKKDGRHVRAKGSPFYDPRFDGPRGVSRLDPEAIRTSGTPRSIRTQKPLSEAPAAPEAVFEAIFNPCPYIVEMRCVFPVIMERIAA